jgi:hypothetical protein
VIAYSSDSIVGLVETASSLGGPTSRVITMAALWDKRGTSVNAIIAIGMSFISWIIAHFVIEIEFPVIFTIVTCSVAYFGSLPFTRSQVVEEQKAEVEIKLG